MRKVLTLSIMLVLAAGCSSPRTGDLLFVYDDAGEFSEAVRQSTDGGYSHVGFYEKGRGVWEASPGKGVVCTPRCEFSAENEGRVKAYRPSVRIDRKKLIDRALQLSGRPYDLAFEPGDSALYCSEFVQECYASAGLEFESIEMNFCSEDGEVLPYWRAWYDSLGRAVPQGKPGTNPNDLSRSPLLRPVTYRPR